MRLLLLPRRQGRHRGHAPCHSRLRRADPCLRLADPHSSLLVLPWWLQVWLKVLPLGLIFFIASFNLTILQVRMHRGLCCVWGRSSISGQRL